MNGQLQNTSQLDQPEIMAGMQELSEAWCHEGGSQCSLMARAEHFFLFYFLRSKRIYNSLHNYVTKTPFKTVIFLLS